MRVRQNARKARKTAEAAAETFVSAEADDGGEGGGGGGEGEGCGGEGGGGGEGGEGGGEGATQEILIVLHELAGPVTASVHANFARNAEASKNILVCAVVAADPVHEEMLWLNAEAEENI